MFTKKSFVLEKLASYLQVEKLNYFLPQLVMLSSTDKAKDKNLKKISNYSIVTSWLLFLRLKRNTLSIYTCI